MKFFILWQHDHFSILFFPYLRAIPPQTIFLPSSHLLMKVQTHTAEETNIWRYIIPTKEGFHSFLNKETSPSPTDRLAECWFLPINTIVIPPMFLSRRRISLSTPLECFQPFAKPKKPPAKVIHSFHFRIINLLFTTYIFIYISKYLQFLELFISKEIFSKTIMNDSLSLSFFTHIHFSKKNHLIAPFNCKTIIINLLNSSSNIIILQYTLEKFLRNNRNEEKEEKRNKNQTYKIHKKEKLGYHLETIPQL